jgi:hypothetical protein
VVLLGTYWELGEQFENALGTMIITQWGICCEHIDTLIGASWEQIENIKIQKIQTTFCFLFLPPIPIPPSPNKKKLVLML